MNACVENSGQTSIVQSDIAAFAPAIEEILRRVTKAESTTNVVSPTEIEIRAEIGFPDGIGGGEVVANLFTYRDDIRLDIELTHNRKFARGDGTPSNRSCFLNDFMASTTLERQTDVLPQAFIRHVVAGIAAARDAVRRYNKRAGMHWNEVRVAAEA